MVETHALCDLVPFKSYTKILLQYHVDDYCPFEEWVVNKQSKIK